MSDTETTIDTSPLTGVLNKAIAVGADSANDSIDAAVDDTPKEDLAETALPSSEDIKNAISSRIKNMTNSVIQELSLNAQENALERSQQIIAALKDNLDVDASGCPTDTSDSKDPSKISDKLSQQIMLLQTQVNTLANNQNIKSLSQDKFSDPAWKEEQTDNGDIYYWNTSTNQTTFTKPKLA